MNARNVLRGAAAIALVLVIAHYAFEFFGAFDDAESTRLRLNGLNAEISLLQKRITDLEAIRKIDEQRITDLENRMNSR